MRGSSPYGGPSLEHLNSLYALAQTLAPDAEAAARLVDATYRRAAASSETALREGDRLALFRLMAAVHAEAKRTDDAAPRAAAEEGGPSGFRQRAARRFLRQHLPAAYAALAPRDRLLLALCKVERLSCADAGHVLGLAPDAACSRLDKAQAALWDHLRAQASEAERRLLANALAPGSLRPALRALVEEDFAAPPTALGPALENALQRPRPADAPRTPLVSEKPYVVKDRPRRAASARRREPRWRRMGLALALIVAAGLVGFLASEALERTPDTNLLVLSARYDPGRAEQAFRPRSPAEAERLVQRTLGQRLAVPSIAGAALSSVRIAEVAPGARVPVFLFESAERDGGGSGADARAPIRVYAYTYALLDRFAERLRLSDDLLREIAAEGAFEARPAGDAQALVWRERATIFVAFPSSGSAEALRARVLGEREKG